MKNHDFSYNHSFAHPAAQSLLESGQLDAKWISALRSIPNVLQIPSGDVWPASYFGLMHFSSMYLPLRYWAWSQLAGKRNASTEETLANLQIATEETLWGGAMFGIDAALNKHETDLVNLVFGQASPLNNDEKSLASWERRYLDALREVSAKWQHLELWPRWPSMAMHFASFYLDLRLTRNIDSILIGDVSTERRILLDHLSSNTSPAVSALVAIWLAAAAAPRDDAGTPLLGTRREGARRTNVRSPTEALLVGRSA